MNLNLPQLSTIRITCNKDVGTAVIYYPDADTDYVYILTAKHCLTGEKFDKNYMKEGIVLDQIFDEETSSYHTYTLSETAVVVTSVDNEEDMALLIIPKSDIIALTGKHFFSQVIDTDEAITEYKIRGFANFNNQKEDQPFSLDYIEDKKYNPNLFALHHKGTLDTFFQQAMENVAGLSGSGAYSCLYGKLYFTGIIHKYIDGNTFIATKILAYNQLIPPKYKPITVRKPETDAAILHSYEEMDKNRELINTRTRETVGSFHVPRDTKPLINAIKENNVVIVHGKPGVGKSALAKSAVSALKSEGDYTIITLTAENLYSETMDEAMKNAGYSATILQIAGSPLSGKSVLIWIESFEKLIESEFSGAFNELLNLMQKTKSITLLITIREYLLQRFRITYCYELPKNTVYLQVDDFNDTEMELVREAIPQLSGLLENRKINHLLHNPYYLDKALRIIPFLEKEQHLDEIKFKNLMWQHIVENGNKERGIVFYEICVKRAREMSLFTPFAGDEQAIAQLIADNILQINDGAIAGEYSPSHDILEDWSLIRYISEQKRLIPDAKSFLESMENTPSMRRAFRLWMEEYYLTDPVSSVSFVHDLLQDTTLSEYWKDELLVVSLRSAHASILLDALEENLLENKGQLLKRIMVLLQTGCKRPDPTKQSLDQLLPVGSGWDYIIDFTWNNFAELSSFNIEGPYISLIASWAKQLPEYNQQNLPACSKSAVHYLEYFVQRVQKKLSQSYKFRSISSFLRPYIKIIFQLTAADPSLVESIVKAARDPEVENGQWSSQFLYEIRKYITEGVMSDQICRFFPDDVLTIAVEDWSEKAEKPRTGGFSAMIDSLPDAGDFGLDKRFNVEFGFPSAYYTFFYWMFIYHPDKALDFVIKFLNAAFAKNQSILSSHGKEVEQITVYFQDGTSVTYYGTPGYWSMFRGHGMKNRYITSLLMALEAGLLDMIGSDKEQELRIYLQRIIKESNNVAFLGIVASVLQAKPDLLDEVSVSLLGVPSFFMWDANRWSSEFHLSVYNEDEFEKTERLRSNAKIHRRKYYQGLVGFVADYMFIYRTHNEDLYKEVDSMWNQLSPEDKLWKKFLFDMDSRKYEYTPVEHNGKNMYQFQPGYDEDIQKNVIETLDHGVPTPTVNVLWARKAFDYEPMTDHNYETWKVGYSYIQNSKGHYDFMTSTTLMATLGLRDFYYELQEEELSWCKETIIDFAEKKLAKADHAIFNVFGEQAAFSGLSYIINENTNISVRLKVKELIFRLLLSGLDEQERKALQAGIVHHLAKFETEFVLNCWYGLLSFIEFKKSLNVIERQRRDAMWKYGKELDNEKKEDVDEKDYVDQLTKIVLDGSIEKPTEFSLVLDRPTHWLFDDALRIIPWKTPVSEQQNVIQNILKLHIEFLNDRDIGSRSDFYDSRHEFTFFYPRFLLSQPIEISKVLFKQLLDQTNTKDKELNTRETSDFLYGLVKEFIKAVANGLPKNHFWALWEVLREWTIENENTVYAPLFLMDLDWTADSENWQVLEGKNLYYKKFISEWGFKKINESIKFLNGVAFHQFMPDSLNWIVTLLKSEKADEVNIILLESFAEKAFYKYGNQIKTNKELLDQYLFILDFLIDKVSAKGYMLKEELVQYK